MFVSFFPRPALFFSTAILWSALSGALWYAIGPALAASIGLPYAGADVEPIVGLGFFFTNEFLFFYLYFEM